MCYGCIMKTITIKNIPVDLHSTLKSRAKMHGRSLNNEVIMALESSLHSTPVDAGAIGIHARAVRETTGVYLTQRDLDSLKNEGRR